MISGVTVPENTNSYTVTGLNGIDNYIVTVTANDSCRMMMSDPITVYGKNVHIHSYVCIYMYVCVPVAAEAGQELPPTFIIQGRVLPKLNQYNAQKYSNITVTTLNNRAVVRATLQSSSYLLPPPLCT